VRTRRAANTRLRDCWADHASRSCSYQDPAVHPRKLSWVPAGAAGNPTEQNQKGTGEVPA
jgi:hypothetical protein